MQVEYKVVFPGCEAGAGQRLPVLPCGAAGAFTTSWSCKGFAAFYTHQFVIFQRVKLLLNRVHNGAFVGEAGALSLSEGPQEEKSTCKGFVLCPIQS